MFAEEAEGLHAKLDGEDRGQGIRDSYMQLWKVVRLPAVRKLALVLLAFRLAVLPAEQAAPLKLLEKGVSKEALAGLVCRLLLTILMATSCCSPQSVLPVWPGLPADGRCTIALCGELGHALTHKRPAALCPWLTFWEGELMNHHAVSAIAILSVPLKHKWQCRC